MADAGGGGGGETTKRIIVMGVAIPEKAQLHAAMLALQFGYAGFHVVSRAALNMGMSKIVFPVYRNLLALLLLLPFAYFLEKKDRPPLSWKLAAQFFLLAIVGITANQGFYLVGLDHTSPTFASAIQNSVPAITFLLAALLRIETVRLNRKDGVGKVAGTLFCVCGASVITLYKGPVIYSPAPPLRTALPAPAVGDGGGGGKSWRWEMAARPPGSGSEEVPGSAHRHLLPVLLRRHPVPRRRRLLREGPAGLARSLRRRALHRLLCWSGGIRNSICSTNMVHRPGRSGLRRGLPTGPDSGGGAHGFPGSW